MFQVKDRPGDVSHRAVTSCAPRWMQLNSLAFGASSAAYMAGCLTPYFLRALDITSAMKM